MLRPAHSGGAIGEYLGKRSDHLAEQKRLYFIDKSMPKPSCRAPLETTVQHDHPLRE